MMFTKLKKNSEVKEGVGRETDLLVLRRSGLKKIDEADLKILDKLYEEELKHGKNSEQLKNMKI